MKQLSNNRKTRIYCHLVLLAYYAQQRKKGLQIHHCDGSCQSRTISAKIKGADEQEQLKKNDQQTK